MAKHFDCRQFVTFDDGEGYGGLKNLYFMSTNQPKPLNVYCIKLRNFIKSHSDPSILRKRDVFRASGLADTVTLQTLRTLDTADTANTGRGGVSVSPLRPWALERVYRKHTKQTSTAIISP
ncbi:unnamed protein product, partial [Brenthis ino]